MRIPVSPSPPSLLPIIGLQDILVSRKWDLSGVLICISLMTCDVEHVLIVHFCILALYSSFAQCLMELSFYCWVVRILYIFQIQALLISYIICKNFLQFVGCLLPPPHSVLWSTYTFNLFWWHLVYLFFVVVAVVVITRGFV